MELSPINLGRVVPGFVEIIVEVEEVRVLLLMYPRRLELFRVALAAAVEGRPTGAGGEGDGLHRDRPFSARGVVDEGY